MLNDRKITDWTQPVSSLDDRPQMTASALKAAFDSNTNQLKPAVNGMIDDLTGTTGAGNIGVEAIAGVTGTTVQSMLAALKALIDLCDTEDSVDDKLDLKADKTTTDKLIKTVSLNAETGVFTFTTDDGTQTTIDTMLEKIPVNCYLDGQEFVLVLDDGTEQRADLSDFLTPTEFTDSSTIDFSVSGSTVTATIKNGSITLAMLESTVLSTIQGYVTAAQTAAGNASTSETNAGTYRDQAQTAATNSASSASEAGAKATLSQSWAIGGTGTRQGEDTNNSKYYSQQSAASAQSASTSANSAMEQADSAEASAASALQSASNAEQSKNEAAQSKSDAATSAQQSAASASAASQSASESAESKAAAASSASSASGSASAAAASEQSALESKNAASASAQAASASAAAAAASQASAADSNTAAQSAAARAEQAAEDAEAIVGGDYIPNSQKGVAGGVATLDSSGKVPSGQLPEMNYIPTSQKGAANGVASLDASGKLESTQKPDYTAGEVGALADPGGGTTGQILTKTASGAAWSDAPDTGVTTFNSRTGAVMPQSGDYTADMVGAVPTTRKVNGKALSADVTLSAADVGAIANPSGGKAGQILTKTESGAKWGDLGAAGGSLLTITFDDSFAGLPYTITGGEESYSGTVPTSLEAVHSLLAVNTVYTLSIQNETFTITTEGYFTALELTAEPSTPIDVPTVSGTLTYTGEAQSPTWSGYDEEEMTIGGKTSGTNAGTYTATFTPNAGYKWSDGTNTAKSVQWSIGKATPTLTLSPTSLSLVGTTPKTSAISYNGDGALTAQSNNTGVATVSLSGTTLSVTAVASGSTTVTVRAASGTNYLAASATLSVSAARSVSFAADSWATIAAMAESGIADQVYSTGDTKDITISGVGTMTLEIADFDHDYLSGSTSASKAGISMITRDLLPDLRQMNSRNTNVGGFPASALYDYLNGTILNGLPSDLRSVLKTIYKWYGTGNNTTNGQWHGCKVWTPLEYEMFGTTTHAPATEHTTGNARKYPIFTGNASRIKRLNNGSGSANWYWEASPTASHTAHFCRVNSSGSSNDSSASNTSGVCFGLSI